MRLHCKAIFASNAGPEDRALGEKVRDEVNECFSVLDSRVWGKHPDLENVRDVVIDEFRRQGGKPGRVDFEIKKRRGS